MGAIDRLAHDLVRERYGRCGREDVREDFGEKRRKRENASTRGGRVPIGGKMGNADILMYTPKLNVTS